MIDYPELLEVLKECHECVCEEHCPYYAERHNPVKCMTKIVGDAADAIEEFSAKQTPMKVAEIHVDEYFCPACGAENNCDHGNVQDTYCPVCGQRLWAEPRRRNEYEPLF